MYKTHTHFSKCLFLKSRQLELSGDTRTHSFGSTLTAFFAFILSIFLMLTVSTANAQNSSTHSGIIVTGIVTDAGNETIPGVIVREKGGTRTALTNAVGRYIIEVTKASAVLVLSFVASATAIYGSRGSNGVVLITTKCGSARKTKINISYSNGSSQMLKYLKVLDAQGYAAMANERYYNRNPTLTYPAGNRPFLPTELASLPNYNQQKELNKNVMGRYSTCQLC